MSRTVSLAASASVILDGDGNGTAEIGPTLPGEIWSPVSVSISCTGAQPAGLSTVYLYSGNGQSPGLRGGGRHDRDREAGDRCRAHRSGRDAAGRPAAGGTVLNVIVR